MKEGATEAKAPGNRESHRVAPQQRLRRQPPRACSSWGKAGHLCPATVYETMTEERRSNNRAVKREEGRWENTNK